MVFIPPLKPIGAITTVDESDPRYIARINEELEIDGARIRLNVYYPRTAGPKWPVLMCTSPYGKDVPYLECEAYAEKGKDLPEEHKCKHLSWEAPSPAWWCPKGYAIVHWDMRGIGATPGKMNTFSTESHQDYAAVIEWTAKQSWCTGKIGLTGISYLGLAQWGTAALQPRGLACICPWEGMSDYYREACRHGGIYHNGLGERWYGAQVSNIRYGTADRQKGNWGPDSPEGVLTADQLAENTDNVPVNLQNNEWMDDEYFKDRMVDEDYSKIQVPLLSAGNWGGLNLHLRGNVLGYMRAGSKEKFMRIHTGRHDLPYYLEPYITYMKSFYDCYLKDDDHGGWKSGKQAPVSFAVRRGTQPVNTIAGELSYKFRDEGEWPLARTKYTKHHLSLDKKLGTSEPSAKGTLSYKGLTGDSIFFSTESAQEEYEVCGHSTMQLAMSLSDSASENPDIDVFVSVRKFNEQGEESSYSSSMGAPTPVTFGWIRATHRALCAKPYPECSDLPFPSLSHLKKDKKEVKNDVVYNLKFELWPTEVVVQKGEKLVVEVSPKDPEGTGFFVCNNTEDRSSKRLDGTNNIHFGPEYENSILLPLV